VRNVVLLVCLLAARPIALAEAQSTVVRASWYGGWHENRRMADGCRFHAAAMTAAHKSLPLGTLVRVTNLKNDRHVLVTITDRGPYIPGRMLDLSKGAAAGLGAVNAGVIPVRLEVVGTSHIHRCHYR
jgi:rare lipoprotein A